MGIFRALRKRKQRAIERLTADLRDRVREELREAVEEFAENYELRTEVRFVDGGVNLVTRIQDQEDKPE